MKKQLHQLDKMISEGKILEAFRKYFHDEVVTWSHEKDKTTSKKQKEKYLNDFFDSMKSLDVCKFHGSIVDGDTSYSKFTFLFTNKNGEKLKWKEIIRRRWEKGLVKDEFYSEGSLASIKKTIEKAKAKAEKIASKKIDKSSIPQVNAFEALVADQKPIDNTSSQVPKKVLTNTSRKTTSTTKIKAKKQKPQLDSSADLTMIDGIGPKIKELLQGEGIKTFEQVANANPEDLRSILLNKGGTRYNANNPMSWPQQAALAAKGQWEELKALKLKLKLDK